MIKPIHAGNQMPTIGVDFYHFAPIIADVEDALIYDTAVRVPWQTEMSWATNSSSNPFYADNGAVINNTSLGNQEVTTTHAGIVPELFANMIGGDYNGALNIQHNIISKERGVLFRVQLADGSYKYFRFWKGSFTVPDQAATTQGESIDYQTQQVVFSAVQASGKEWFVQIIQDNDPNVLAMGLTPKILEDNIADFNWDPFTGNALFKPAQKIMASPSELIASLTTGELLTKLYVGIENGEFESTISDTDLTSTNMPAGLTIDDVKLITSQVILVGIDGKATAHTAADSITNLSLTVANTGIKEATAALTTQEIAVKFK